MKRMYSAVPGRVYVATRAHSASGDRELSLSKGDKVKGEKECEKRISMQMICALSPKDFSLP